MSDYENLGIPQELQGILGCTENTFFITPGVLATMSTEEVSLLQFPGVTNASGAKIPAFMSATRASRFLAGLTQKMQEANLHQHRIFQERHELTLHQRALELTLASRGNGKRGRESPPLW